jgi:hypothetical protein
VSRLFEPGDIIIDRYRWLEEAQAGRSPDGAKDRPSLVVIDGLLRTVDPSGPSRGDIASPRA